MKKWCHAPTVAPQTSPIRCNGKRAEGQIVLLKILKFECPVLSGPNTYTQSGRALKNRLSFRENSYCAPPFAQASPIWCSGKREEGQIALLKILQNVIIRRICLITQTWLSATGIWQCHCNAQSHSNKSCGGLLVLKQNLRFWLVRHTKG